MPPRRGRIALGTVEAPGAPSTTSHRVQALEEALVLGASTSRYGRDWRLGGLARNGTMFTGRVGFERAFKHTELWDEDAQDFLTRVLREGATSPFALDARSMIIAFQLRSSPQIKRRSFTGAFEALLREGSQREGWHVMPLTKETTLEDFAERVEVLTQFKVRVLRPNPDYKNRRRLSELMERTKAETLDIAAQSNEGVELDDPTVQEAIAHADAGYGHYLAKGTEQGNTVGFDSRTDEAPPEVQTSAVDAGTGEVALSELEMAARRELPEEWR